MRPNRLINEKSPYLRQHAYNPVDWYPWGEEAFLKAQTEDKPIFLSIGYSTCHWCHVMEKESFEDEEIAEILNRYFVSIKVDREERPDIDNVYMKVCYFFNERGGWPLTIIITPDKKPFFADTYIPKDDRYGRIGLKKLLFKIIELWTKERKKITEISNGITNALQNLKKEMEETELSEKIIDRAFIEMREVFDQKFGGFGKAPKFPMPLYFIFLTRYYYRYKNEPALEMTLKTLKAMRSGGIFDQIGFGFHRYSTDREWLVPHFEKMLYDNALLMIAYTEAYQITKDKIYSKVVEEIATFLIRDLYDVEGAFYSALDADSEGKEGEFYIWSLRELMNILDEEELLIAKKIFNLSEDGNFIEETSRKKVGKNIIYLATELNELSKELNIEKEYLEIAIENIRNKIFKAREHRIKPFRDDKILTDWNALTALAFTKASMAFNSDYYKNIAQKCIDFILNKMFDKNGRLLHMFKDNEASIYGYLEDYSYLILALIEYYLLTLDSKYLIKSINLTDEVIRNFWDYENGGFIQTANYSETILTKIKEAYDGVLPSGNSTMCFNLIRLSRLIGKAEYEKMAFELIKIFSKDIEKYPSSHILSIISLDLALNGTKELLVVTNHHKEDGKILIEEIQKEFIPDFLTIVKDKEIEDIAFNFRDKLSINSKTTYYLCKNFSCFQPTTDREQIKKLLLTQ